MKRLFSLITVFLLFARLAFAACDAETALLLHFNEADTSTTTIDSSTGAKTVTANGNAQTDSGQTKFGNTSLLDGTGDYWSLADSTDWQLDAGSNSNTWTIDFWVQFNGDPGTGEYDFLNQYVDGNNYWVLQIKSNALRFRVQSSGTDIIDYSETWNPATATWYHVALVKNGTTGYLMFVDGTQLDTTATDISTIPDFAATLWVGSGTDDGGTAHALNGWMEEVRVSKGSARWTGNFTPPTAQYCSDRRVIVVS